jgi:hypothetical protein
MNVIIILGISTGISMLLSFWLFRKLLKKDEKFESLEFKLNSREEEIQKILRDAVIPMDMHLLKVCENCEVKISLGKKGEPAPYWNSNYYDFLLFCDHVRQLLHRLAEEQEKKNRWTRRYPY